MKYIYKLTNKINNKIYIGKANDVKIRWNSHIKSSFKESNHSYNYPIHCAIRKYGADNFNVEIIDTAETTKEINEKEKYWINKYNSRNNDIGYNLAAGGDGGDTITTKTPEEYAKTIERMSAASKGRPGWSKGQTKETNSSLQQLSNSLKGNTPWNKGLTSETDERVANWSKKVHNRSYGDPWNKGQTKETNESLMKTSNTLKGHKKFGGDWKLGKWISLTDGTNSKKFYLNKMTPEKEAEIEQLKSDGWYEGATKRGLNKQLYNSIKIQCVETGKVYNSLQHAVRELEGIITAYYIKKSITTGKSFKGLTFIQLKNDFYDK